MEFLINFFPIAKIPIKGPNILGRRLYFEQQSAKNIFFYDFVQGFAVKTKCDNKKYFFQKKKKLMQVPLTVVFDRIGRAFKRSGAPQA